MVITQTVLRCGQFLKMSEYAILLMKIILRTWFNFFFFFSFNKDIAQTWKLFSPFPNFKMKWLAIRSGITWGPRIGQIYKLMPGDGRGHHSWRMLPTQSEGSVAAATSSLELSQRRHGNQQAYPHQLVLKTSQGHENLEHNGITWWSYGGEQETTPQ